MLNNITTQIQIFLSSTGSPIQGIQPMKPTYIFINPDDCNWQFGYEDLEKARLENPNLDDWLQGYINLYGESIPVYIY